jgi:hydroxypyruvate reductase
MDAAAAVAGALKLDGPRLEVADKSFNLADRARKGAGVYAIAVGKAALPMARALDAILGEHVAAGLVVGPAARLSRGSVKAASTADSLKSPRWRIMQGGHPLPDGASLRAARAAFELLERAGAVQRALVIFLISGGGSAMIEWPRDPRITLRELRAANRALVSCGAKIAEINSVRRSFSAIKGGGLAARAARADQLSLIVSDTGAGEEANVASGPTFDPPLDAPDAREVIARYGLAPRLPASVLRAINQQATSNLAAAAAAAPARAIRAHYVLLDNARAIAAAARAARGRGFAVELARDIVEQPVAEGCAQLLERLRALRRRVEDERRVVCLISGGEFACPVRGRGVGGRNAETMLRCAIEMGGRAPSQRAAAASSQRAENVAALSAGTDGIDGNSPAAGAIIDQTTLRRARRLRLDAQHFLDASDAYSFFDALGDAIVTGPTGTNVRDLRVLLAL